MADSQTFTLSVVTPERVVLECTTPFVAFPAHDGEIGVLLNRAPLVCRLGVGPLRVQSNNGEPERTLIIDGGFAQVLSNRLTILTSQAFQPDEIDAACAEQKLVEARAMVVRDDASVAARDRAQARARVELRYASPSEE